MKKAIINGLFKDLEHNAPIVQLLIEDTNQAVHIWIGGCEAWILGMVLEKVELDRPLTHDLLINILRSFQAKPVRVTIHSLKKGIFHAKIFITKLGLPQDEDHEPTNYEIDCRASDAIIIAAKLNLPIYISSEVIYETAITVNIQNKPKEEDETFKKFIQSFNLEDLKEYLEKEKRQESSQEDDPPDESNDDHFKV
jgi:bifunctional DNase/RNase